MRYGGFAKRLGSGGGIGSSAQVNSWWQYLSHNGPCPPIEYELWDVKKLGDGSKSGSLNATQDGREFAPTIGDFQARRFA